MCRMLWFVVLATVTKLVWTDDIFTNRFANIRFTPTFIDKTPLLHRAFDHKYLTMYAPYRFGKSANIGMFNLFFSNLRTKETLEEYFNGTEIWKDQFFVQQHMGQYPVILFNTTNCGVVYDEEHMVTTFQWVMYNSFLDHKYLLDNENITGETRELLQRHLTLKYSQCLFKEEIVKGVAFLAELLYLHHEKPVIVLVDGFCDGVVERLFEDNMDLRFLNGEIVKWYSALFNFLIDNTHVERIIGVGEAQPYGLHLPQFQNVGFMENPKFSHFFGFTYYDLEYLLCMFNIPLEQRPDVLRWYCGYASTDGDVKVCNPLSILHFLYSPYHRFRMYSFSSSVGRDLLQRLVGAHHFAPFLGRLVQGISVNLSLALDLNRDVGYYRHLLESLPTDAEGLVTQVLLQTGMLGHAGQSPPGLANVKFPSEEIRVTVDQFLSVLSWS